MMDAKLLDARKKLEAAPNLTDKEFKVKMSPSNHEISIDDLQFGKKKYDVLDYVVIDPDQ
jgi:hypothetical protein